MPPRHAPNLLAMAALCGAVLLAGIAPSLPGPAERHGSGRPALPALSGGGPGAAGIVPGPGLPTPEMPDAAAGPGRRASDRRDAREDRRERRDRREDRREDRG
ncbi:MAG: hypothetical protein ACKOWF_08855, partial [Chloroflexota bacterium]